MDAKFAKSGRPIAERVLVPEQARLVGFAPYFNETLFHELSHGLGPGLIKTASGERVDTRLLLKETYSTIEEAKADAVGAWNVLYALDQGWLTGFSREEFFATLVGLMFRSMRFGIDEAHGRGTAAQWNWFREKGAVVPVEGGRFRMVPEKMEEAIRSVANELLMIEATGDYERSKRFLAKYGVANDEMRTTIEGLSDIPVDIAPVFTGVGE